MADSDRMCSFSYFGLKSSYSSRDGKAEGFFATGCLPVSELFLVNGCEEIEQLHDKVISSDCLSLSMKDCFVEILVFTDDES